ncbi:MAG: zinc ribbon domain-containing protein [Oscillospiraceae bacterium]|nr:zinc ribbon domain-containing protein [Oscillospiraceae bacterium]
MANFCQNCGAAVQPGAKFCIQCGAPIVDAPAREAAPVVETPAWEAAPVSQPTPIAPQERGDTPQAGQYVYSPEIPAGKGAKKAVKQASRQTDATTVLPPKKKRRGGCLVVLLVLALLVAAAYFALRFGIVGDLVDRFAGGKSGMDAAAIESLLDYAKELEENGNPEAAAAIYDKVAQAGGGELIRQARQENGLIRAADQWQALQTLLGIGKGGGGR